MNVRDVFRAQGKACASLGSPFMGRMLPLIADRLADGAVAERILNWPGDPSTNADSVPLRLAGALHALKIQGLALGDVYPPTEVSDQQLWNAIEASLEEYQDRILQWLNSPPQTNEVRRSAPLIAGLAKISQLAQGPIDLLELGCSGGLNLGVDRFRIVAGERVFGPADSPIHLKPDWNGASPPDAQVEVVCRRGVDLSPVDVTTAEGRLRLRAYLWPDQDQRIKNTNAAIQVFQTLETQIDDGDAASWLERQIAQLRPERVCVVFHTVAWQYFPEETKKRAENALRSSPTPIFRFGMEADGGKGARLRLTHYPSGKVWELGRADFHGRWVNWQDQD